MSRKTSKVAGGNTGYTSQYNNLRDEARPSSWLMPYAKTSTPLALSVNEAVVYFGTDKVEFAGGDTESFTAPTASPRADVLSLNSSGVLVRTAGTEADTPTIPDVPVENIPICVVYNRAGQTSIKDEDDGSNGYIYKDLRRFLNLSLPISIIASNNLKKSLDNEQSTISTTYTLLKQYQSIRTGWVRIKFDLKKSPDLEGSVYARIYRNGVAYGTEQSTTSGTYSTFSEDIFIEAGCLIQLYGKGAVSGAGSKVCNFRFYWDVEEGEID